jgi:hypothetical protein
MSQIFSDPPFRRGSTLLGGDFKDTGTGLELPGTDIVGSVKVFQDVNPSTGERYSNRLVYCVAVRYKGSDVNDATTLAGKVYVIDTALENGRPFATITSLATEANVAAGRHVGVLDEYLTGGLKQNDVVWLVVKGPASALRTAAAVNDGVRVQVSGTAGSVIALTTGTSLGIQIEGANTSASAGLTRVNLVSDIV